MGVEQGLLALVGAADFGGGYEIEQSLRFNNGDSAHLHRTPSSAGSQTTFTLSVWVKSSVPSSGSEYFYATHNGSRWNGILRRSGNYDFGVDESGASAPKVVTNAKLRDPSAWYHLVMAYDTTQATSTDRVKIWINGALQSINTGAGSYPSLNHGSTFNRAAKHWIGALDDTASVYYTKDFYLAEYHLLDGTAVTDADDFGEYDESGVWRPIEYEGGNYGTTGFYLKFDPSATNGIGHDHSGNGNNWTASGFTTSGTGTDVMSDTPTTNWCTLNPISNQVHTLSNGNLDIASASGNADTRCNSTIAVSSGKWYYEVTLTDAGTNSAAGIGQNQITNAWPGNDSLSYAYGFENAVKANNGSSSSYGSALGAGDVFMCAFDLDNSKIFFGKNGTWFDSSDPAAGTNSAYTLAAGAYNPVFRPYELNSIGASFSCNFGQRDFAYTPPTGYKALNTANLPAPDIADGSQYFNTVLYTGNGSYPRAVTGAGFSPDWVWLKSRSDGYGHGTYDRVRGVGTSATALRIDSTSEEGGAPIGPYIDLDSLDTDGFTLGNTVSSAELFNLSTKAYAAWCWKAVGSGSSIAAGSIDGTNPTIASTVSANPTAGFSIVTYTGTGVNATVGHGLGVKPSFYVVKPRSYANNWPCWHKDLTSDGYYIHLNYALKQDLATAVWNGTGPSNTVFNIGTNTNVNQLSATFVAYVFAEVEGYSRISFYSGNGSSSNAPFVYCGFRPAFVLIKNYRGGSETNWVIKDTVRDTYNPSTKRLNPNQAYVESDDSNVDIDFLANGFKVRSTNTSVNESGSDYLFLAFAENPFGGSGVSPATAR